MDYSVVIGHQAGYGAVHYAGSGGQAFSEAATQSDDLKFYKGEDDQLPQSEAGTAHLKTTVVYNV